MSLARSDIGLEITVETGGVKLDDVGGDVGARGEKRSSSPDKSDALCTVCNEDGPWDEALDGGLDGARGGGARGGGSFTGSTTFLGLGVESALPPRAPSISSS